MRMLSEYASYIQEHKSLFNNIINMYKRQEKLTDYMNESEDTRKKLEEQGLAKKETWDKNANDKQRAQIKETTKKIEKTLATR
jgi:chromosome condensin MukBEF ATPase and DNA-binding subunit MukB